MTTSQSITKSKSKSKKKLILIVGNDDIFNHVVKIRLEENGYKTLVSSESDLTNETIMKNQPDLLLYNLDNDDITHASELSINNDFSCLSRVKTIYFGTKQDTQFKWQALSDGSAGFIEKPYHADELLSQISNAFLVS
tara:strand:+ start:147399 stop:147812 length:414 start_codon:yes stop_codon:yes gene_type:complete